MKDSIPLPLESSIEVLKTGLAEFTQIFVVIDGLDKTADITREDVIEVLKNLDPKARLLANGRPYVEDIPSIFRDCYCTLNIFARDHDVSSFVQGQIKKDKFLRKHTGPNTELEKLVVTTVVDKAKGM